MELVLLAGKYVLVALIYLFVFLIYRGLMSQALQESVQERHRARATQVEPREPPVIATPMTARPVTPAPSVAAPLPALLRAPTPTAAAASVREALADESGPAAAPGGQAAAPEAEASPVAAPESAPEPAEEQEPAAAAAAPPAPRVGPEAPRLVVMVAGSPEIVVGREFALLAAATLGRAEHNLIALPDRFLSSQHAIIFLKDGRRVLRDRDSTNGTLVNGQRVTGDVALRDGDEITVGGTKLRYTEPPPAPN